MRTLLALLLLVAGPAAAQEVINAGGCEVPLPPGFAPTSPLPAPEAASAHVQYDASGAVLFVSWTDGVAEVDRALIDRVVSGLEETGMKVHGQETRRIVEDVVVWAVSASLPAADSVMPGLMLIWRAPRTDRLHQWAASGTVSGYDLSTPDGRTAAADRIVASIDCGTPPPLPTPPPGPRPPAPDVHPVALLKPTFETPLKDVTVGFATLALHRGRTWLLTAHHHFGVRGAFKRAYKPDDLPSLVSRVGAVSPLKKTVRVIAGAPAVLPDAKPISAESARHDLAAFAVKGRRKGALILSTEVPDPWSPVWVVTQPEGEPAGAYLAWALGSFETNLLYVFDDSSLGLKHLGGSPIVNADGHLVGLHLGYVYEGGRAMGIGHPVGAVGALLDGIP